MWLCTAVLAAVAAAGVARALAPAPVRAAAERDAARRIRTPQRIKNNICIKNSVSARFHLWKPGSFLCLIGMDNLAILLWIIAF
jgi:hypothetical protein